MKNNFLIILLIGISLLNIRCGANSSLNKNMNEAPCYVTSGTAFFVYGYYGDCIMVILMNWNICQL